MKIINKNPIIAPAKTNDNDAISVLPLVKEVIEIVNKTIIDIPDDNPSSPSIKLIALVIPTIHKTVIAPGNIGGQLAGKKSNPFK